jgi:hypothetical protein
MSGAGDRLPGIFRSAIRVSSIKTITADAVAPSKLVSSPVSVAHTIDN